MITLLILIANMWWVMFTGEGFIHGDIIPYVCAGLILALIEIYAIVR